MEHTFFLSLKKASAVPFGMRGALLDAGADAEARTRPLPGGPDLGGLRACSANSSLSYTLLVGRYRRKKYVASSKSIEIHRVLMIILKIHIVLTMMIENLMILYCLNIQQNFFVSV